jgi:FtsH-binding integral membrane protein
MNQQNNLFGFTTQQEHASLARTFLAGVFGWMTLAMAITAFTAWSFASNIELLGLLFKPTGGLNLLGWIVMLAPFGFVLLINFGFQRFSALTLSILFGIYSVLMGMSLSFIFIAYSLPSIAKTFVITAGMFGTMAVMGYTTKADLSRFGSILMMALVGLIIASLVNMFMQSGTIDYIISFAGVVIFTGLTAWDVQKLKRIGSEAGLNGEMAKKLTILGALTLYLDFVNLFLFLLRFFGNRK